MTHIGTTAFFIAIGFTAGAALAQPAPEYDFKWATIGAVGNRGYDGPDPFNQVTGRGSVNYAYRISKLEVTTGQWLEFVNTFGQNPDAPGSVIVPPSHWGAEIDPDQSFMKYKLRDMPNAASVPVAGITWRTAARYCNWLHNGKSPEVSSLNSGAYDTSTFVDLPGLQFGDQRTHSPGAKFWIPTLDEWLKAAHYDQSKFGAGQDGWWLYPTTSDTAPVGGIPGIGQTNTKFSLGGAEWEIPVASYPDVRSPWGLLDCSGSAAEWLEDVSFANPPQARLMDGSNAGELQFADFRDQAGRVQTAPPWATYSFIGIRIASDVPSPGGSTVFVLMVVLSLKRKRDT